MKGLIHKQDSISRYISRKKEFLANHQFRVHKDNPLDIPFVDDVLDSYRTIDEPIQRDEEQEIDKSTYFKDKGSNFFKLGNANYWELAENKQVQKQPQKKKKTVSKATKEEVTQFLKSKAKQLQKEIKSKEASKQKQTELLQSSIKKWMTSTEYNNYKDQNKLMFTKLKLTDDVSIEAFLIQQTLIETKEQKENLVKMNCSEVEKFRIIKGLQKALDVIPCSSMEYYGEDHPFQNRLAKIDGFFFNSLFKICEKTKVQLRIPPTIVMGFGLHNHQYMYFENNQIKVEIIHEMYDLDQIFEGWQEQEEGDPFTIARIQSKRAIRSDKVRLQKTMIIKKTTAFLHSDNGGIQQGKDIFFEKFNSSGLIQKFIKPKGPKAFKIRVL